MARRRKKRGDTRVRVLPGSGSTTRRVVPSLSSGWTWGLPHKKKYRGRPYGTLRQRRGSIATMRNLSQKTLDTIQGYRAAFDARTLNWNWGGFIAPTKPPLRIKQSLVCGRRQVRKEVLFANRVAGRSGGSPGKNGTYRRNEGSNIKCSTRY